nr:copia protein [Tanacetum cinerariifolium]
MGFDMSKVECYNYHKKGHFARECSVMVWVALTGAFRQKKNLPTMSSWHSPLQVLPVLTMSSETDESFPVSPIYDRSPKDTRRNVSAESQRRNVPVETSTSNALVYSVMVWVAMTGAFRQKKNLPTMSSWHSPLQVLPVLTMSSETDESLPVSPIYDRYQSGEGYHDVPPSYIGTFMPPKPDLVFHDAPNVNETVHTAFNVKLSPTKPDKDLSHTHRPSAPIIEDWVSNSEDDSEAELPQNAASFVQPTKQDNQGPKILEVDKHIPLPQVEIVQQYVLFLVWSSGSTNPQNIDGVAAFDEKETEFEGRKPESEVYVSLSSSAQSKKHDDKTKREAKGKSPVKLSTRYKNLSTEFEDFTNNNINEVNATDTPILVVGQILTNTLEDITYSDDEEDVGAEADFTNLETNITVLVDLPHGKRAIGTKWVFRNKKDERGILVRNKARLVAQGHTQEEGIDYEEVFAPVARIESIRLFLAYASFMGFTVYQMDVKSAFLYGTIEEKVYVYQTPGFEDPDYPNKVNDVIRLQALVDRKKVIITEATIREALHLDDAESIDCLPNEEIFTELSRMGTSWNEFISSMASAAICLSTGRKFNFSKYIFGSLVRNVDSSTKFYMVGKGFSWVETPLFEGMIVAQQADDVADEVAAGVNVDDAAGVNVDDVPAATDEPTLPSPTPTPQPPPPSQELPSTS